MDSLFPSLPSSLPPSLTDVRFSLGRTAPNGMAAATVSVRAMASLSRILPLREGGREAGMEGGREGKGEGLACWWSHALPPSLPPSLPPFLPPYLEQRRSVPLGK